jgi:hypothetical protein
MYEHNEKLSEAGITEETLRFFHSRTANADWELTEAWPTYNWFLQQVTKKGSETVRVRLRRGHEEKKAEYTIDPAKVRQKRINILLEEEKKKR